MMDKSTQQEFWDCFLCLDYQNKLTTVLSTFFFQKVVVCFALYTKEETLQSFVMI